MRGKKTFKAAAFITALTLTAGMTSGLLKNSCFTPAPLTACADDTRTEGTTGTLSYFKYSDHIAIWGCDHSATSIEIPSTIEGLPVTVLDDYAFQLSAITSVSIPDSVTTIGKWTFANCSSLKSITIPDSVQTIDIRAFESCTSLSEINFPDHLVEISSHAFKDTPWLEQQKKTQGEFVVVNGALIDASGTSGDVVIPSDIVYVSPSAFDKNTALKSVVVPASVKKICDNTFVFCENLTSAELKGAELIECMAFYGCTKLTDLKISGKLTKIEQWAFMDVETHATITFYGTEETWNKVDKPSDEAFLNNATMIFDTSHSDPEEVMGDINGDGEFNIADAVTLQKWLLADPSANVKNWKAGDLYNDDKLDVYDLIAMRTELTK